MLEEVQGKPHRHDRGSHRGDQPGLSGWRPRLASRQMLAGRGPVRGQRARCEGLGSEGDGRPYEEKSRLQKLCFHSETSQELLECSRQKQKNVVCIMFQSMTLAAESSSDRRAEDKGSLVGSYCQQHRPSKQRHSHTDV